MSATEDLGVIIDEIDSLACGLNLPMPAQFHVDQLKKILPEKVKKIKDLYVELTGENPWE